MLDNNTNFNKGFVSLKTYLKRDSSSRTSRVPVVLGQAQRDFWYGLSGAVTLESNGLSIKCINKLVLIL